MKMLLASSFIINFNNFVSLLSQVYLTERVYTYVNGMSELANLDNANDTPLIVKIKKAVLLWEFTY